MPQCSYCHGSDVRYSRWRLGEFPLALLLLRPLRCRECYHRFWRLRPVRRPLSWAVNALMFCSLFICLIFAAVWVMSAGHHVWGRVLGSEHHATVHVVDGVLGLEVGRDSDVEHPEGGRRGGTWSSGRLPLPPAKPRNAVLSPSFGPRGFGLVEVISPGTWQPGGQPAGRHLRYGFVPCWLLVCLTAVLPAFRFLRILVRRRRDRIETCQTCGADISATPGHCRECGTIPEESVDMPKRAAATPE